jgi:hypothetical protein
MVLGSLTEGGVANVLQCVDDVVMLGFISLLSLAPGGNG